MKGLLGCLGLVIILAVLACEAFSFVLAHRLLVAHARDLIGGARWTDTVLPILLLQASAMVAGVLLIRSAIAALPNAMLGTLMGAGGGAAGGRMMVRMFAGILLIVPGFFLDVVALLMLSPLGAALAGLGQRIAMSLVRQQMAKMFPGGMPGTMGRGMPFPGMMPRGPLTPDAHVGRSGKVIDITAERVDKG